MLEQAIPPVIGDWYRNLRREIFEVVALDEDDGTVEIQYFDGSLEEIELDTWFEAMYEPVEPPEDWSGSLDIEREDYGVDLDDPPGIELQQTLLDRLD
jgi:hypothetical protein